MRVLLVEDEPRIASQLAGTPLLRLYAERGVTIAIEVPPEHAVRGQREDLDEMLGNLLDNACKWARSRVARAPSAAARGASIRRSS